MHRSFCWFCQAVAQLFFSESHAEDALIARMSYSAAIRAEEMRLRALSKFTIKQVAKIAFIFCVLVRSSLRVRRHVSHVMRNPVFGVCDQVRLKPACSATETS